MKTLKSARKPRDTVFDAARRDTVLDLSDLVGERIKPEEFFPENYITEGMKTLLTEGFRRLEGKSDQGVIKLLRAPCAYPRGKPRGITAQKNKSGALR